MQRLRYGPRDGSIPELSSLGQVLAVAEREPDAYVRFSKGPDDDVRHSSKDFSSGLALPGLSVNPLRPPDWWGDRSRAEWVARQLCTYAHLDEGDKRAWLLMGREHSDRGPDNEPLLVDWSPIATLASSVIDEA